MSNDEFALLPGYIDGPSGDLRLRPDPAATVPLAAMPGWAWAPVDQYTQEGEPFPACPRRVRSADGGGGRASAGSRCERRSSSSSRSAARRDDGEFEPAHEGPGYSDIALVATTTSPSTDHGDGGAGAAACSSSTPSTPTASSSCRSRPRDPVAPPTPRWSCVRPCGRWRADTGWSPRSRPRWRPETGNGTHLHLSLWDGETTCMSGGDGPAGMHGRGEAFVAGMLEELPATRRRSRRRRRLSYLRLQPHHWSGAMRCWGIENREAALRFIAGPTPATAGGRERRGEARRRHREPLPRDRARCWPPACTAWTRRDACRRRPRRIPRGSPTT